MPAIRVSLPTEVRATHERRMVWSEAIPINFRVPSAWVSLRSTPSY